ncbi:MAG: PHP domain-containing protein, partial [Acutalibacteraceae bacterium]|nr:PHP domain-containing protein [Acutalibacteraceae bacterium]
MKIYYDLHIHSALSPCGDNDMTPNNIVNMAMLNELDMIAVTDHNSCKNCVAAVEIGQAVGITVVPGMELTTSEDIHVVCYFPDVDTAKAFDDKVSETLLPVPNKPEIFGHQYIMNKDDEITGELETLLIGSCDISIMEVTE